jgi:hypothetical protein
LRDSSPAQLAERAAIGTVVERKPVSRCWCTYPARTATAQRDSKEWSSFGGLRRDHDEERNGEHNVDLPEEPARSVTWDRAKEMSAHAQFKVETGIPVFADPQAPLAARHEREH